MEKGKKNKGADSGDSKDSKKYEHAIVLQSKTGFFLYMQENCGKSRISPIIESSGRPRWGGI